MSTRPKYDLLLCPPWSHSIFIQIHSEKHPRTTSTRPKFDWLPYPAQFPAIVIQICHEKHPRTTSTRLKCDLLLCPPWSHPIFIQIHSRKYPRTTSTRPKFDPLPRALWSHPPWKTSTQPKFAPLPHPLQLLFKSTAENILGQHPLGQNLVRCLIVSDHIHPGKHPEIWFPASLSLTTSNFHSHLCGKHPRMASAWPKCDRLPHPLQPNAIFTQNYCRGLSAVWDAYMGVTGSSVSWCLLFSPPFLNLWFHLVHCASLYY
jgi:hypothetical protein